MEPWFHRIDLGGGIFTKTESVMGEPIDHPHGPWQTIQKLLPADLRGKTVLDVGCNAGFYAFAAKRRGAERVLGVDGQRQHVRQGLFVRKVLGLEVEFRRLNVYELNSRSIGQFDITLALGLLYHLKHPMLALENLYQVTKELLIIETAIMPPERTPASFSHPLGEKQMLLHSLAFVENPAGAKEQVFNWFLPGVEALLALLRSTGFAEVQLIVAENERAVVACRKGQTDSVVHQNLDQFVADLKLVTGPLTCAANAELSFRVQVENVGLATWPTTGAPGTDQGAVSLGSHLLRDSEDEVNWDYGRAALPRDLRPGETAELEFRVRAPETPGKYIVEFDMVAEHITWFEDHGSGT
ncbi:MAG: tRNA (mo5U34)-methyltransferase, partial [Pyrinomonadaceae bacterium]|nr:tRNA (mo5U34)-methyltransferase [Pyrinomonadaceae bacterium]